MEEWAHLEKNILNWAKGNNIVPDVSKLSQGLECAAHVGDIISRHQKGQSIINAIGDVYISLVLQAYLSYSCATKCREINASVEKRKTTEEQIADLLLDVAMLVEGVQAETHTVGYIGNALSGLDHICEALDLSLEVCINMAYYNRVRNTVSWIDED
tara:strand:+ start:579 stop:1049 length:471 start_codon:yes stop_codon:yes gene_type:complete